MSRTVRLSDLVGPTEGAPDPQITGITADSRLVEPGFLFAALPGVKVDGRIYIPSALERGAAAILSAPSEAVSSEAVSGAAHIVDANPRVRLAHVSARFYPRQPATIVAVTGTNGKSSTVEFLRQIWAQAGLRAASLGTLGARVDDDVIDLGHTTPDPVAIHATLDDLAGRGVTHLAMEASSHGLAQHRLDAVRLAAVGFTNLTQDHLDYHPTFEDYRDAKIRLFSALAPAGAPAMINVDGAYADAFLAAAQDADLQITRLGWKGRDIKLLDITPRMASQTLGLLLDGEETKIEIPLVGEFQSHNALMAYALACATGVDAPVARRALGGLQGVPGRLQQVGATPDKAPVFVDYAHTPDGIEQLLKALRPHTQGRLIIVFGCGGDRDPTKRAPMGAAAATLADIAIVTDDNPRSEDPATIRAAICAASPRLTEIGDRAEAIAQAIGMLRSGDALVIAGKGHETGQIFADRIAPFDDAEQARSVLNAG